MPFGHYLPNRWPSRRTHRNRPPHPLSAKGLAIVAGTQRRHMADYLRNKAMIDAGAIGQTKGGVVQWNGVVPWIKRRENGESDASYIIRN